MSDPQTCQGCGLWRRNLRPARDESTAYRTWRPCAISYRPAFTGNATIDTMGREITSPDSRCANWADRRRRQG